MFCQEQRDDGREAKVSDPLVRDVAAVKHRKVRYATLSDTGVIGVDSKALGFLGVEA